MQGSEATNVRDTCWLYSRKYDTGAELPSEEHPSAQPQLETTVAAMAQGELAAVLPGANYDFIDVTDVFRQAASGSAFHVLEDVPFILFFGRDGPHGHIFHGGIWTPRSNERNRGLRCDRLFRAHPHRQIDWRAPPRHWIHQG